MKKRTQYTAEYKTGVVLRVLREEETVSEIASSEGISSVMIGRWKAEFMERASMVFDRKPTEAEKELATEKEHTAELERKVGQLTIEVDWLKKNLRKLPPAERKSMVEKAEPLTMTRQAELLQIHRTCVYERPAKEISDETVDLMHQIDRIHTQEPTWGYRMITGHLRRACGLVVNRKRVRRLMGVMGIHAIYPGPNLSKRYHAAYVRPYLLRKLPVVRANQVWGVDITYIPVGRSFVYLFVIIDWYSRYIVDWELSTTLDKQFVLTCMQRALQRHPPEIVNSDQGGHFTNPDYIDLLTQFDVRISMDGKGQCLDNARTERFFRTLKYDRVYIHEYLTPRDIRRMLGEFIPFYNDVRPHSSLAYQAPAAAYYKRNEPTVA